MNEVDTMREFFNRLIDQFNTLTGTAQRVSELEQHVNTLSERISKMEQENEQLRYSLTQAENDVRKAQAEAQLHRDAAVGANEAINALRETIANADNRVVSLNEDIRNEKDSHRVTKADLDDARKSAMEWESQYVAVKQQVDAAYNERDEATVRATNAELRANDLQSKLDRLTAILSPSLSAVA